MMQNLAIVLGLGLLTTQTAAISAFLGSNGTQLQVSCAKKNPNSVSYGKDKCRCIGIDNLKGYYASQENFHHVQRTAETGASCSAWDKGMHPECLGTVKPGWCSQEWCYVDPCSCDLDVLPKQTVVGITYQGMPAYWSYNTCGSTDFYSQTMVGAADACVNQKDKATCSKQSKCAWDGKQCGGKEILETCKALAKKDEAVYGQEDCRCVGLGSKDAGKAFMHINEKVSYDINVGSTCHAWESDSHPDCLKDGDKPSWCSAKWCFVDPCKCKTATPPKAVMPANRYMRFQGKTAYWTYATCGSEDTWSSTHKGMYCAERKTEAKCVELSKCAWNGKSCLGKALVEICAKQEETGVLGMETPLQSGSVSLQSFKALILVLMAFGTV